MKILSWLQNTFELNHLGDSYLVFKSELLGFKICEVTIQNKGVTFNRYLWPRKTFQRNLTPSDVCRLRSVAVVDISEVGQTSSRSQIRIEFEGEEIPSFVVMKSGLGILPNHSKLERLWRQIVECSGLTPVNDFSQSESD